MIIFLDFDGVINTINMNDPWVHAFDPNVEYTPFNPNCVKELNKLLEIYPNVVISSTWRSGRTLLRLQEICDKMGLKCNVVGKTDMIANTPRGWEIRQYVQKYKVKDYLIVDDESDMLLEQKARFIKVDPYYGYIHNNKNLPKIKIWLKNIKELLWPSKGANNER